MSEVHNLDLIKGLDVENLPDVEKWGDDYIAHLTATMQEMYGEDIMAALPEDRIKPAMQGVIIFQVSEAAAPFKNSVVNVALTLCFSTILTIAPYNDFIGG